jgi:hypothetical protein
VNRLRSGPLAAWTSAWLAGAAASDEVLRATIGHDAAHHVQGLPDADEQAVPLSEALIAWRRAARAVRVVLPVAGDVRGLPGPADFRSAALEAGEAVHGGGIGLVPEIVDNPLSSAPTTVFWRAFAVEDPPPDVLSVPEAQHDLTEAIRESASALSAADVANWMDDVSEALSDARRAGERVNLPPGYPPPGVHLVAQAERMQAVLEIAALNPMGGAIDRAGIAARTNALRPLATAVRRARLAGYNALAG